MSQNVGETLGAILIGSCFAATLTGVVCTQTVYYFQSYPDDRPSTKLTVAVIWLLDFLHTIMVFSADWVWLIEHFDDLGFVNRIPWPLGVTVFLNAIITVIVHFFFAYKIYRLSKGNWLVVGPILVLAVTRLSLAIASCAEMLIYSTINEFVEKAAWVFTMGLLTSSILDVVITSSLIWYLDHARTGFMGMDRTVNRLCLYAVENGLLTSVTTVIALGCWLGMEHNLTSPAIYLILAKLYANSLLATLNSRKHIRECNRITCLSDRAQHAAVFGPTRGSTLKRSTGPVVAAQASEEKPSMRHGETVDIPLSPVQSQVTMRTDSVEIPSTSKMKAVVDVAYHRSFACP